MDVLITEVKEELKVTWTFEDDKINRMIKRGRKRIMELTGTELLFLEEDLSKDLLLAYCRYSYNNALEYFLENFAPEILELQLKEAMKQSEEVIPDEG